MEGPSNNRGVFYNSISTFLIIYCEKINYLKLFKKEKIHMNIKYKYHYLKYIMIIYMIYQTKVKYFLIYHNSLTIVKKETRN